MNFISPFHIWDVILPVDELIFFKMVIAPPTSDGFLLKLASSVIIAMLVGGLEHFFSIQLGMSSSQLTHIFQRGR